MKISRLCIVGVSCFLSSCLLGQESQDAFSDHPQLPSQIVSMCPLSFSAEMTPVQIAQTAYRMQQQCELDEDEILKLARALEN